MGFADFFNALDVFDADIQQSNGRALNVKDRPRHGRAHQCKFGELAGCRADIGADIEHNALRAHRRPQRRQGRPFNASHRPQNESRHGHQATGIASRNGGIGFAGSDSFERQPHAGALAAPQGLTRLFVHGYEVIGVDDARARRQARIRGECGIDTRAIATKNKFEFRMALKR